VLIKVASTKWTAICWSLKLREAAGLAPTMLTLPTACPNAPAAVTAQRSPLSSGQADYRGCAHLGTVLAASSDLRVRCTQGQSTASAPCFTSADRETKLLGADPGSLDPVGGATNNDDGPSAESSGELSTSVPEDKPQFPGLSWWRALMGRWRREDHESYACYALMVRARARSAGCPAHVTHT